MTILKKQCPGPGWIPVQRVWLEHLDGTRDLGYLTYKSVWGKSVYDARSIFNPLKPVYWMKEPPVE